MYVCECANLCLFVRVLYMHSWYHTVYRHKGMRVREACVSTHRNEARELAVTKEEIGKKFSIVK